ncbi:MAG: stage II sporulation protein D [Oscillospiraceae bacterium]|nr:stage II sporulation protein D [Oscillospiraceae bacterium]
MRGIIRDFFTAFFIGLILPAMVLGGLVVFQQIRVQAMALPQQTQAVRGQIRYKIRIRQDDSVTEGDLDDYLVGVLLAEMPTEFPLEALKAQAVAARTYARKAYRTGGKHADSSICTDSLCCQAYIAPEVYLQRGGTQEGLQKVIRAVEETSGLVLTYGEDLIEATYFSSSGGTTEAAAAVWGTDYPYLQSVPSPGEEKSDYHYRTVTMTPEAFVQALDFQPEGPPEQWMGIASYTAGGSVQSMTIGDKTFTGTQLRSLLQLPSAAFLIQITDQSVKITTKGYGHRVGMSQYGAQAMAEKGSSFREILAHYYPGSVLESLGLDG